MSIDLTALRTYIKANETLNQWGVVDGNTGKVQQWFAEPHESEKKYRKLLVTELDVLNAFANPLHAEVFMQKLEAIAAGNGLMNNLVARTVRLIKTSTGVNIADPRTQAQLQAMMSVQTFGDNAVTQAEYDAVTGLAAESKTRGEVEFGVTPTIRDIDTALKLDRTDGRVGGN